MAFLAAPRAQAPKRLWVLDASDTIVERDLATFAARGSVKIPPSVVQHPESLLINAVGQMACVRPTPSLHQVWFWDGTRSHELPLGAPPAPSTSASTKTRVVPRVLLSADGTSLIWFENRFEIVADSGGERSVRVSARVWRTDLAGRVPRPIADLPSPGPCNCETGICSDTCPEWFIWAPDETVGAFFVLTHYVPGQVGSRFLETRLYRRSGSSWRWNALRGPVERALAASATGETLVVAVPDAGCCGWDNESDDRLLLWKGGEESVLFDEFARYANRDYDVSFYPVGAGLSPGGGSLLAYTLDSTASAGVNIRLSSAGETNAEELARVRRTIGVLPTVEIVRLGPQKPIVAAISHATLVGWLSEREILVEQDGRLAVYDSDGVKRRDTGIAVRSAADAFLR